jgi:galactokinase
MAINRETIIAAAPTHTRRIRAYSANLEECAEIYLDQEPSHKNWYSYVEGVARVLESEGHHFAGADLVIQSDVPIGAGLSSSAALEVSTGIALLSLSGQEIGETALAQAARNAENNYAGVQCGIMDQLVSVSGRRGQALLIDCRSLSMDYVGWDQDRAAIVICNSKTKHELGASEYNTRRDECRRAVELLRQRFPSIRALRDVSLDDFESAKDLLPEPLLRRCRHVITENERALAMAKALTKGNFTEAGELMYRSHESLRDDYEVSSKEQDVLVSDAAKIQGVFGSRMTGAGFGGCTVTLLRPAALADFREAISKAYCEATGIQPEIYVTPASDGAGEIV